MKKHTKYNLATISIIFSYLTGINQNSDIMADKSIESWSIAEFRYYPSNKFRFGFEQQIRFNENITVFDRTFTELNGRYSFWKDFDFGLSYRYMFINDNKGQVKEIENHYRWDYSLSHEFRMASLKIDNRVKFQHRKEIREKSTNCICETRDYLRLKSEITYKIKNWKYDPDFSFEIFLPADKKEKKLHNRYRLTLGTDMKISKKQNLRFKFLFEQEIKDWNPKMVSIFQIKYTYTIKNKNKNS